MTADRQKLVRNAERLVGRGKLNAAIEAYLAVLDSNPDDTTTLNRVGDLYVRLKRLGEAIELFKRAAEHFSEEGFVVKAIAIYKKILRLDPLQLEASESLADLQTRQGLIKDARQQYLAVAEGYQRRGDTASNTTVHRKLVELEPDDPAHRLHLAELFKKQDQILDAQDQYGAIAELLLTHEKVADALTVCREAFELDHENLNFVSGFVGELKRGGHEKEAAQFLEFATERNPAAAKILTHQPESLVEDEIILEIEDDDDAEETQSADLGWLEAASESVAVEETEDEDVPELEPEVSEDEEEEEEFELEVELEDFQVEATPEEIPEVEGFKELVIEAEVLARYGLEDKAVEKFEEVIDLAPHHLDSHLQLITLHLQHQNVVRVAELAEIVAGLADKQSRQADWDNLERQLVEADFEVENGRVVPPEVVAKAAGESAEFEEVAVGAQEDMSWLDEVPTGEVADGADTEEVFESEAEFFDLASELEKELDEEEGLLEEDLVAAPEDQTLEEIVEGFKRGMAETLSAEDYDTHYNLGIAYREMGLIDEAVSEFQLAAKDHRYLVDCCSLLASCFIEKGFPELAIKWYNEGLSSPIITEDETLGLVYELGDLYMSIGETEEARLRFVEIYGVNSDYRDVGTKLAELEQT